MNRETDRGRDQEAGSDPDRGRDRSTTADSAPRDDHSPGGGSPLDAGRRGVLALGGVLATGLTAGCLGYEVVDREAVTEREVRIAELESTVAEREERIAELEAEVERLNRMVEGPEVNLVRAVDSWSQMGDVVREQTDTVAGETLTAAVNYDYPVHPAGGGAGRADASVRVRLTRGDETVAEGREDVSLLLDRDASLAENGVEVDVGDVDPGPCTLVAVVVDRVTTLRSEPARTDVVLDGG